MKAIAVVVGLLLMGIIGVIALGCSASAGSCPLGDLGAQDILNVLVLFVKP